MIMIDPQIPACGTFTKYADWSCRCETCREFYSDYQRKARAAFRQRSISAPQTIQHGKSSYSRGCRCKACTKAATDYMRNRRAKLRAQLAATSG